MIADTEPYASSLQMPPRFFASPYKNALATPAKKEGQWSELPVSTSANTDASDLIATGGEYWVAQGSVSGEWSASNCAKAVQ